MTFLPTKPSGLLWMACSLSRQLEAKGSAPGPRPAGLSLAGGFSPLPGASFPLCNNGEYESNQLFYADRRTD